MNVFVILPDQLYLNSGVVGNLRLFSTIYLVEEPLYFETKFSARYRCCMKIYYNNLIQLGINVKYIPYKKGGFIKYLSSVKAQVHMYFPTNLLLWGQQLFDARFYGLPIKFFDTPGYILSRQFILNLAKKNVFINKSINDKKKYIHRYIGQLIPFESEMKKVDLRTDHSKEWISAETYAKDKFKELSLDIVPFDHMEAEYALYINDIKGIKWSLHVGLLTPDIILRKKKEKNMRNYICDREFDRLMTEIKINPTIKHRRYEYDKLT